MGLLRAFKSCFSLLLVAVVFSGVIQPAATQSPDLPDNFVTAPWVSGFSNPTAMAFAPDGRLFVAQQGGDLRVVQNGILLETPFVSLTVHSVNERGLLGVTFDPDFDSNPYVYVYYTVPGSPAHNRVSRFLANGNVAQGNEDILLDIDDLGTPTNHNGGALHFGPDGKLYVAVGDAAFDPNNAQNLNNLFGSILRINADGSIPTDNPFYATLTGDNRAIWAYGLRNPFTFAFQPGTGLMYINDVGAGSWEEINEGTAGGNYGWPDTEGYTDNPDFISPLFAYQHDTPEDPAVCAIAGGSFYNPVTNQFPAEYVGDYFFADYCAGWIKRYDTATGTVHDFASNIESGIVDIRIQPDGTMYYLSRQTDAVHQITYSLTAPTTITGSLNAGLVLPTFSWQPQHNPDHTNIWYRVIVQAGGSSLLDVWQPVDNVCSPTSCEFTPTIADLPGGLLNGDYALYVQWWSTETGFRSLTGPTLFTVDVPLGTGPVPLADAPVKRPWVEISLQPDDSAAWYHLWIGTPNFQPVYFDWLPRPAHCNNALTCTLRPPAYPASGTYIWYIQSWGAAGFNDDDPDSWQGPFDLDMAYDAPGRIEGLTATIADEGSTTFAWAWDEAASWYNIWVGSPEPVFAQAHFDWHWAVDLNCADDSVCTLPDIQLSSGEYAWYVQAWGPGGFSTNGDFDPPLQSWVRAANFTVP